MKDGKESLGGIGPEAGAGGDTPITASDSGFTKGSSRALSP